MSFNFGNPSAGSTPSTNFSFGGSTANNPPAATGNTGFSFGNTSITPIKPSAASTPAPATGFSLGGTSTASTANKPIASAGGFSFGTPGQSSAPGAATTTGFSLGSNATTAASVPGTASAPASSGFSFGGGSSTSAPSTGLSLGSKTTASVAPLGFGASTTTASGGGTSLAFGSTNTTTSSSVASSGFGGFGGTSTGVATTSNLTQPSGGLGGSAAPTTAAAGLGGSSLLNQGQTSSAQSGNTDPKLGTKSLKESQMPNEIVLTVEDLKKHIKEEKTISSDMTHASSKLYQKIKSDIDVLNNLLKTISAGLSRNKLQLDKLKLDAAQELLNAEIAQRTKDTPPALQYENVAPYEYFTKLITNFEAQMIHYRRQIEETEQHLQIVASQHVLTIDDVTSAIYKLQTIFTNLAARYQKIHEAIQEQKMIFLKMRRQKFGISEDDDIFAKKNRAAPFPIIQRIASHIPENYIGPSPFEGQQDPFTMARASLSFSVRPAIQQGSQQIAGGAPPPYGSLNQSSFQWGQQQQSSLTGAGTSFLGGTTTNPTPGLLGNSLSPFGNMTGNQSSSLFQSPGMKRGKL